MDKLKKELLEDGFEMLWHSKVLLEDVNWNLKLIEEFDKKHTEDYIDSLDYNQKEQMVKQLELLQGRLNVSSKELKRLDEKYLKFRNTAVELFGQEIEKKLPPL